MKKFILFIALALSLPPVFANQMNSSPTAAGTPASEEVQEEQDSSYTEENIEDDELQLEEDREVTTPSGDEIEYDKDVLGDDEIEIND